MNSFGWNSRAVMSRPASNAVMPTPENGGSSIAKSNVELVRAVPSSSRSAPRPFDLRGWARVIQSDAALGEQRRVERAARRDVAAVFEVHPAHAEVAEFVLVGEPDDVGRSRTPRCRSSNSRLTMYSNAAPWQVQVPWPTPTTNFWRSPAACALDGLVERAGRMLRVVLGAHRLLWPSGPRPGVLSKRSRGPVALIR
jgi:hypothetical protein